MSLAIRHTANRALVACASLALLGLVMGITSSFFLNDERSMTILALGSLLFLGFGVTAGVLLLEGKAWSSAASSAPESSAGDDSATWRRHFRIRAIQIVVLVMVIVFVPSLVLFAIQVRAIQPPIGELFRAFFGMMLLQNGGFTTIALLLISGFAVGAVLSTPFALIARARRGPGAPFPWRLLGWSGLVVGTIVCSLVFLLITALVGSIN